MVKAYRFESTAERPFRPVPCEQGLHLGLMTKPLLEGEAS